MDIDALSALFKVDLPLIDSDSTAVDDRKVCGAGSIHRYQRNQIGRLYKGYLQSQEKRFVKYREFFFKKNKFII